MVILKMVQYVFKRLPVVGEAVNPDDLEISAALAQAVVDYTGDGTNDRVIDVGLAAKFYVIFGLTEWSFFYNLLAWDSTNWTLVFERGYPYAINLSFVEGTGINVGKWNAQAGLANNNGQAYRIIAYG